MLLRHSNHQMFHLLNFLLFDFGRNACPTNGKRRQILNFDKEYCLLYLSTNIQSILFYIYLLAYCQSEFLLFCLYTAIHHFDCYFGTKIFLLLSFSPSCSVTSLECFPFSKLLFLKN